jgi:LytS/YehU family sensor histidine kinase
MVNKAAKYDRKKLPQKIVPALIIFYAAAFLIGNLAITISVLGWFLWIGRDMSEFFPHLFQYELTFSKASYFLWLTAFTVAFFYILWQKSVRKELALEEENLKYRYSRLKSQVNPHFLFNSLNTLSEIVYTDARRADNYIQQLASIYRYILDNEETDFVPLIEELSFVGQYFSIQKERDNGKIALQADCPNAARYKVIPVSLQLLAENALKHNSMSEKEPLTIRIYEEENYIVFSNPL